MWKTGLAHHVQSIVASWPLMQWHGLHMMYLLARVQVDQFELVEESPAAAAKINIRSQGPGKGSAMHH